MSVVDFDDDQEIEAERPLCLPEKVPTVLGTVHGTVPDTFPGIRIVPWTAALTTMYLL